MLSIAPANFAYYAGIMLNAFALLLCSKLCWHNRLKPTPLMSHLSSHTMSQVSLRLARCNQVATENLRKNNETRNYGNASEL